MSKNLLNYEGLEYFLSKLLTYIESQRTIKNVDTTASNGINLSNTNGTLGVTVTPGSVADGNTGLVTGDAVYDAIDAVDLYVVSVNFTSVVGTANKTATEVITAAISGKEVVAREFRSTYGVEYRLTYYASNISNVGDCVLYSRSATGPITSNYTTSLPKIQYWIHVGNSIYPYFGEIALINSPTFTGEPKAPTADLGTNNTQIATTAFVTQTVANALIGKAAFQGTVDSLSDIPNVYKKGYHWLVQTAGTYFTQVCEVGDIIYCVADSDATHEASWSIEKDFTVILNNLDIAIISNSLIDALFTNE